MAVLDDPTQVRRAGETSVGPTSYTAANNPYLQPAAGYTPTDWTKMISGNSGYMNWALSAAERKDVAAANRTAALRALAIRYGAFPKASRTPTGTSTRELSRSHGGILCRSLSVSPKLYRQHRAGQAASSRHGTLSSQATSATAWGSSTISTPLTSTTLGSSSWTRRSRRSTTTASSSQD
jgi:hypothetical protein